MKPSTHRLYRRMEQAAYDNTPIDHAWGRTCHGTRAAVEAVWAAEQAKRAEQAEERAHRDYVEHFRDNPHDPLYN